MLILEMVSIFHLNVYGINLLIYNVNKKRNFGEVIYMPMQKVMCSIINGFLQIKCRILVLKLARKQKIIFDDSNL